MYEGNNPIAQRSRQWIQDALIGLMKEKNYNTISVKEICARADLSRQTFYNLYASRDDILHELLKEEVGKAFAAVSKKNDMGIGDMVDAFASVLTENREILLCMINQGQEAIINEEIADAVVLFAGHFAKDTDAKELEYSVAFLSGGLARCLLCWFKSKEQMEREELVDFLMRALGGGLYQLQGADSDR